ncbi:hypothetical protein PMAYCL1PPCAC_04808, partial [Pristionchus mayeri]
VLNGASMFSYTLGKFLIVVYRFLVLTNISTSSDVWSSSTTTILICCQLVIPFLAHLYFAFAPVYFANGRFTGFDNSSGPIYRGTVGVFYAVFSFLGIALNIAAYMKLRKLVLNAYKQQRMFFAYTITCSATHLLFAFHHIVWAYSFFTNDKDFLNTVRYGVRPYVYDITTFLDPIMLVLLSKQVRVAFSKYNLVRSTGIASSSVRY